MFAANISTVHLVSLAESAYKYGLIYGNFEWMAGFALVLLSLLFAPLYLRSRVATLPDYLERRYNRKCRDWLAVISIVSAIVIHIGVTLYTAAWVLRGVLGINPAATIMGIDALMFFIIILSLLTGLYTMVGGLLSVVLTESAQTVLLLAGAVAITVIGYVKIGGWSALVSTLATHPHPMAGMLDRTLHGGRETSSACSAPQGTPQGFPWYAIFLGYPVLGSGTGAASRRSCRGSWRRGMKNRRVSDLFSARSSRYFPSFSLSSPASCALRWCRRGCSARDRRRPPIHTHS